MNDPSIMQKAGPWPVQPILRATIALARAVSAEVRSADSTCEAPRAFHEAVPEASDCKTVNDVVSMGAMLVAAWAMEQKGPGATDWPAALRAWLDDWEGDFLKSDGGDERAGFGRLASLLEEVSRAVESSSTMQ